MNLDSKAVQMLLGTVIKSLGIDAQMLLNNIQQFQGWVVNAIKHHDNRLIALETATLEISAKQDRILELLETLTGENHGRNEHAAIEYDAN
jgi:hypothetical protein